MHCTINGITHRGEGVGRIDGKAVFVPHTIPGETVEIKINEDNKNYMRGKLIEVIKPSKDRVMPVCPHFYECGGCAFQHMTYARQLLLKRQIVQDSMQRIGKINCEVKPVLGMENPWRYRNKVEWHLQNKENQIIMGYYKQDSHELIEIKTCKLISHDMEALSFFLKDCINTAGDGKKAAITIRQSSLDGSLLAVIEESSIRKQNFDQAFPGIKAIYEKKNGKLRLSWGQDGLEEQINTMRYKLAPLSFFQVNPQQTRVLCDLVLDYCDLMPGDTILDAYCGVGSIALYLAPHVKKVYGVESYTPAVANARENAKLNNIRNCEFITGPCETEVPQLKHKFDVAILDPPRAGCKPGLIQAITAKNPRTIVCVSCNPSTLARDLAIFSKANYTINDIQPVDMFPQTGHVETVVLMSRG